MSETKNLIRLVSEADGIAVQIPRQSAVIASAPLYFMGLIQLIAKNVEAEGSVDMVKQQRAFLEKLAKAPSKAKQIHRARARNFTEEDEERLMGLLTTGLSVNQMAKNMGFNRKTIYERMKKLNLKTAWQKAHKRPPMATDRRQPRTRSGRRSV